MKWIKVIQVCFILFGTLSCGLKEDFNDCDRCPPCPPEPDPVGNVELTFSYLGDTHQPEMFAQMIERVTLMAYGADGQRTAEKVIAKADLDKFQGTKLDLAPGEYRIVCWGNAYGKTELARCETFLHGRVHHPNYPTGGEIDSNDHLYYGYLDVVVPAGGEVSGDVPFKGAHINMEVYVRGANSADHPHLTPMLKVHKLMPQYNLDMQQMQPFATTYHPSSRYNMGVLAFESKFQTLRFDDENPVEIEVRDTPDSAVHTISLQDYMRENDIKVAGKNEATVRILIEFTDLGVNVGIPEWEPGDVTPEYE